MNKTATFASIIVGTLLCLYLPVSPAQAQASRTWVSGVGDDANPCSRTAPCKTFAGAISKTAAGGEIDALDPGGFGAVTITKAITLDGGGGQVASVLVSGTNGIVVAAQPSDVVILRNLRINGIGSGLTGIHFISGKQLIVDHADIFGFATNGVDVTSASALVINNSTIANIGNSGITAGTGATVSVDNVRVWASKFGIAAAAGSTFRVNNSVFTNASNSGVEADPGGTMALGNSDISFNVTGISGATTSFGNNRIFGNTSPGTAPTVGAASTDHGQQ